MQLIAPDGVSGDYFGYSTAIDGDTLVVGAYGKDVGANPDQGAAYVYRWTGSAWAYEATLTTSDGVEGDQLSFYFGVAIDGDTIALGAWNADVGTNPDQGAAYVFARSGTTWTQQARLTATDGAADDRFGFSIAIQGDTVVVGAIYTDVNGVADQGAAYVFTRSGTTWTRQARLTASGGAESDIFGVSVAISGDTVVVGATGDDVGANPDQGSAYVFTRSGSTWNQQAQLVAADGASADQFGSSIALSGDTALVGAFEDDVGGSADQGSAYVFTRSGTVWVQQAHLTATDGAAGDRFAYYAALSGNGNTIAVGAPNHTVGANVQQGVVYAFAKSGMSWTEQAILTSPDGEAFDHFGFGVAVRGATVLAGSSLDDVGPNPDQGSAWVFDLGPTDSPPTANAGPDQSIHAGQLVTLDGRASFDDNTATQALVFSWSLVSAPEGSQATLSYPGGPVYPGPAMPAFFADRPGEYLVQLVVEDEAGASSAADQVVISSFNQAPTANAGPDTVAWVGDPVFLTAISSTDPEGDDLTYEWTLIAAPTGSGAAPIPGPEAHQCSFVPDLPGDYTLELVVDDGFGPSLPDAVTVTVLTGQQYVENAAAAVITIVESLPPTAVASPGNQSAFNQVMTQVIRSAQRDDLASAKTKLENAMERTDGWVLRGRADPTGPGRDWITDETTARYVYGQLQQALEAITP